MLTVVNTNNAIRYIPDSSYSRRHGMSWLQILNINNHNNHYGIE